METFTLYTQRGISVVAVQVPIITPRADVLVWTSRAFVWDNDFQQYRERLLLFVG